MRRNEEHNTYTCKNQLIEYLRDDCEKISLLRIAFEIKLFIYTYILNINVIPVMDMFISFMLQQ